MTELRSIPRRLYVLAALALAGFGLSIILTQHYYEVRNGTAGFKSFCNLGETVNCDVVAASPYADLVAGLPLSSFSAGWFLALFFVALIARNAFWRREALRAALLLTGLGTLFSLAYLWIMIQVIHTYCVFCLWVDAIAFVAFGIVLSLKPEGLKTHKPDWKKWKPLLALTLGSVVATVIGLRTLDSAILPRANLEEAVQTTLNSPVLAVNTGPELPSLGAANAPVTIVEFSDFQCPYCRVGAFSLNSVLEQNPGKVRIVFRNFPLDVGCNRKVDRAMHAYACEAAKYAVCAHQQSKFEEVYEAFFQNQATFAPGKIPELAASAGGDTAKFTSCVNSAETNAAVSRDVEEGLILGVQSTPTFFINGHKVEGVLPPQAWNLLIEKLSQKP